MSRQASSRHKTNGKKTAYSAGALKAVLGFDVVNSLMLVVATKAQPEVVAAAEMASYFIPP